MKKRRFTRIFADYKFQCESNLRESAKICVSKTIRPTGTFEVMQNGI